MGKSSRRGIERYNSNEKSFINLVKYHEGGDEERYFFFQTVVNSGSLRTVVVEV